MSTTKEQWKNNMNALYEQARRNHSKDITGLYIAMERATKQYLDSQLIPEGSSYTFPCTNGTSYTFVFYNNATEIWQTNAKEEIINDVLLKKDNRVPREVVLETIGKTLSSNNFSIGEGVPQALKKQLLSLDKGVLITFKDGANYVCTNNKGGEVTLINIFDGKVENFQIDCINKRNCITIDLSNDSQIDAFYKKNCSPLTERVEYSCSVIKDVNHIIDNLEKNIIAGETKNYHFGNIDLYCRKRETGECVWFDKNGDRVSKNDVALIRAYFNNHPYDRKYKRKSPTIAKIASDASFEKNIEQLSMLKKYEQMYTDMISYVQQNKEDLVIETSMYEQINDNFTPARIIFTENDGLVQAFKITYEDNDFSRPENSIKPLSQNDFRMLCEQIYTNNRIILQSTIQKNILAQVNLLNKNLTPTQEKIRNNAASNTANKEHISVINTKVDKIDQKEIAALINNYLSNQSKEQISAKDVVKKLDDLER